MKKIIEKNPVKAQKIALIILFIAFGLTIFLSLLSYPLIGWLCLGFSCFSLWIFTKSIKIQAIQQERLASEALEKLAAASFSNFEVPHNEDED